MRNITNQAIQPQGKEKNLSGNLKLAGEEKILTGNLAQIRQKTYPAIQPACEEKDLSGNLAADEATNLSGYLAGR